MWHCAWTPGPRAWQASTLPQARPSPGPPGTVTLERVTAQAEVTELLHLSGEAWPGVPTTKSPLQRGIQECEEPAACGVALKVSPQVDVSPL